MKQIFLLCLFLYPLNFLAQDSPEIIIRTGHLRAVSKIVFDASGQFFATAGKDKSIKFWDAYSSKMLQTITGHKGAVGALALSRDGKILASGSEDKTVKIWDTATGKLKKSFVQETLVPYYITSVAFSPNMKNLVASSLLGNIFIWNLETGEQRLKLHGPVNQYVHDVEFSPDGKYLMAGCSNGEVWVYNVDTGTKRFVFEVGKGQVVDIAVRQNCMATLIAGESAKIWDIQSGELLFNHKNNFKHAHSIGLSKDGSVLLVDKGNGYFEVVEWEASQLKTVYVGEPGALSFEFSPMDKSFVVGGGEGLLKIFDVKKLKVISSFEGYCTRITEMLFSRNDKYLCAATSNGAVKVWEMENISLKFSLNGHNGLVSDLGIAVSGRQIVSCGGDGKVIIWELFEGRPMKVFETNERLLSCAWHPEKQFVVASDDIGRLFVFDLEEMRELKRTKVADSAIEKIRFLKDGRLAAMSGNKIKIIDLLSGTVVQEFRVDEGIHLSSINISNDGKYLAAVNDLMGTFNGFGRPKSAVWLWDLEQSSLVRKIDIDIIDRIGTTVMGLENISFDKHNDLIISCRDGSIRLIPLSAGIGKTLVKHLNFAMAGIGSDSGRIYSGGRDGTIHCYSPEGKYIYTLISGEKESFGVISKDGFYRSSTQGLEAVSFKYQGSTYDYQQFDMIYNRPDKILELSTEKDEFMIKTYKKAFEKRLNIAGFKSEELMPKDIAIPFLEILGAENLGLSTKKEKIELTVKAGASKSSLKYLKVWMNGVPFYSGNGKEINGYEYKERLELILNCGRNDIEVAVVNEKGLESLRKRLTLFRYDTVEKPDLYILAAGVKSYADISFNLSYSDKDMRDIISIFTENASGFYANVFIDSLSNEAALRDDILALGKNLKRSREQDHVLLFFSGHGLVGENLEYYLATHDTDFENPEKSALLYKDWALLLDGIPARQKMLLIDACHAGEIGSESVPEKEKNLDEGMMLSSISFETKGDGVLLGSDNSFELMKELFTDLRNGTGAQVLASSGGREYSIEGKEWKNGVFTFAIKEALRDLKADLDGDGEVQFKELQEYVSERVSLLTGGQQNPSMRQENNRYSFRVY